VSDKWLVLKFGGSSVRGVTQWQSIAARIEERRAEDYRVLVVCSAVEGMTDLLDRISRAPVDMVLRQQFIERHEMLAAELAIEGDLWISKARDMLDKHCGELEGATSPRRVASLMALGEWLSTRLGRVYLQKQFDIGWVDARGLLEVQADPERSERRKWLAADCAPGPDPALLSGLNGCGSLVITQGFIAGMPGGGTALLGRGGSDTSAVLLGGRIGAERVEIWTDVPGLFTADPREITHARLLRHLDYDEALEMAASGASVVHARCIRAAAATGTPLWIRDSARPDLGGTLINGQAARVEAAKAVVCQRQMAVLLLQNIDPRQQVGFLAWVFRIIAGHGISIDLVATSETTTTVALNRRSNHLETADLADLAEDLRARCRVDLFDDCVCVNVVGRGVRRALARLDAAFAGFESKPLLMVSQSANDLCLSLLIRSGDETELIKAAHDALIPHKEGELFGPSWLELEARVGQVEVIGGRA
jgi:diaminopimelate decarboxylase/aspartate kinase